MVHLRFEIDHSHLAGQNPLLAAWHAVPHHGQGCIHARALHDTAPAQLTVLWAFGQGLELDAGGGFGGGVGAVAIVVAIAGRRAKSAALKAEGVRVSGGLAAFEHDAVEAAAVEQVGLSGSRRHGRAPLKWWTRRRK